MNKEAAPKVQMGRTIRTFSGIYVDVFDPNPEMFKIEDIAHALSNLCRWGGHTRRFYSVAQHSCYCASIISSENAMAALLHDASEAYLVDLPRPIKHQMPQYIEVERNLLKVIFETFNLDFPLHDEVKEVDDWVLNMEHDRLILNDNMPTWGPEIARFEFMKMYRKLSKNGK